MISSLGSQCLFNDLLMLSFPTSGRLISIPYTVYVSMYVYFTNREDGVSSLALPSSLVISSIHEVWPVREEVFLVATSGSGGYDWGGG